MSDIEDQVEALEAAQVDELRQQCKWLLDALWELMREVQAIPGEALTPGIARAVAAIEERLRKWEQGGNDA